jgi:hypothetical protein
LPSIAYVQLSEPPHATTCEPADRFFVAQVGADLVLMNPHAHCIGSHISLLLNIQVCGAHTC